MQENSSAESGCTPPDLHRPARYQFSAGIEIEWGLRRVWGHTTNISRSGMFIELSDLPEVHARFFANLALNKPLRIEGTVRRVVPGRGIGVSIRIPGEEGQTRYAALLVALALGSEPVAAAAQLPEDLPERPLVACARCGD
jgi:PilZ domain